VTKTFYAVVLGTIIASPFAANAATIIDDPLHGFCVVGGASCAEVSSGGNNVTTIVGSPGFSGADFGFTISPPNQTGPFDIIIALPNNDPVTTPTISGTINLTSVSSPTTSIGSWTSGDIGAVQGVINNLPGGVQPPNPLDNFLGFTQSVDPGATGYNLVLASFGSQTLVGPANASLTAMDLSVSIPTGSMIFGFLEDNPTPQAAWAATASSGVLWDNGPGGPPPPPPPPPSPVSEPSSLALFGAALAGLRWWKSRRKPPGRLSP
jgi:hypothetical protein